MKNTLAVTPLVLTLAMSFPGQAENTLNFHMLRRDFQVANGTFSMVKGDFDGDHKADILLAGNFGLSLLRGKGDGSFQAGIMKATPGFYLPSSTPVADFNRDGRMDLPFGGDLYLGQADGTFLTRRLSDSLFAEFPSLSLLITADFNEDGNPDLAGFDGSSYQVLLGKGDGTFQRSFSIPGVAIPGIPIPGLVGSGGPQPLPSLSTDIDHDGHADLILRSTGNPIVFRIFKGNGRGQFQEGTNIRFPLSAAAAPLLADLNGDQILDWILNASSGTFVAFGKPDGTLQDLTPLPVNPVLTGDFNSDGQADLVGAGRDHSFIFTGSGDGTFVRSVRTAGGFTVLSADWNDDGRLDLAVYQFDYVSILLNTPLPPDQKVLTPVESSATSRAILAPGSLASLFGSGLSIGTEASPALSNMLAGTQLRIRDAAGQTLPAELLYVSPVQINFRIPPGVAVGEATVELERGNGAFTAVGLAQVEESAPTLFGCGPLTNSIIAVAEPGADTVPFEPLPCSDDRFLFPALVTFYGTGFAGATVDNTQVWVHGLPVKPLFVGPAGTVPGLDKVVIRVEKEDLAQLGDGYASWINVTSNGRKTNGGYTGIF